MLAAEDPLNAESARNKVSYIYFFFKSTHHFSTNFHFIDPGKIRLLFYSCVHSGTGAEGHRLRFNVASGRVLSFRIQYAGHCCGLCIPSVRFQQVMMMIDSH